MFGGGAESTITKKFEEVAMQGEQVAAAVYLEVINEMTMQLNKLRYLITIPIGD
jgi:hypothetical protein